MAPEMTEHGVSWRDYVDSRLEALQEATKLSAAQMNDRLAGMNEFRSALKDQTGTFATREYVDLVRTQLNADIKGIRDQIAAIRETQSVSAGGSKMLWALVGLFIAVAGLALKVFM
jgi:hypothetical protein